MAPLSARIDRAARSARVGILTNAVLAVLKLTTGLLGNSYALVADAVESAADVFSSLVVWGGLRLSGREPDERFPFGYGKAEPLSAAVVGLMLIGAAVGISIQAVREIVTPHHAPEPFTLWVLLAIVAVKEGLFRRIAKVGEEVSSTALEADAWHHRSDALTSAAAAIGISLALLGGEEWAPADDWAALAAAGIIVWNGVRILRPAIGDLMDRQPSEEVMKRIEAAALSVPEALAVETLKVRRSGLGLFVDIHVEASPELTLRAAHEVSGKVKSAIREQVVEVLDALVHMEPHEGAESPSRA
jgi:cation diffusion facilitator family transporter